MYNINIAVLLPGLEIHLISSSCLLIQAVEESLKSVNLFHCGFGDKSVSKYSGGMKRRLSVAIALIGNPKVLPTIMFSFPRNLRNNSAITDIIFVVIN
jgi:ABC-type nitrate/sulfonate/bicarbonate transport system ATPase subunit